MGVLRAAGLIAAVLAGTCAILAQVVRADMALMAVWVGLLLYLLISGRRHWLSRLIVASVLALVWVAFAREHYAYNHDFLVVAGLNLFPLFAWGNGLFATYVIFRIVAGVLPTLPFAGRFVLFAAVYWALLVTFEILGYHAFDIRDLAVAGYPAMPGLRCMHAPNWMRAAYFALGPAFFLLCELAARASAEREVRSAE
jgi:hypothetical protein